jgi:predicted ATPase with chaperone activity
MKTKEKGLHNRINEIISTGKASAFDFDACYIRTRFEDFVFDFEIDAQGKKLLAMAYKELFLSEAQLARIERICAGIMALAGVRVANACHIAEAIQYVSGTKN